MKTLLLLATIISSQAFAYDVDSDMSRELTEGKILAAMQSNETNSRYSADYDLTEGKILAAMEIMIEQKREKVLDSLLLLDIILNQLVQEDRARANDIIGEIEDINDQLASIDDETDDSTIGALDDVISRLDAVIVKLSDVNIY